MEVHAKYSGSQAKRFIRCPGSVGFIEHLGLKDEDETDEVTAASEGTRRHKIMEGLINTGQWVSDDSLCQFCLDKLKGIIIALDNGPYYIQTEVPISLTPYDFKLFRETGGSVDLIIEADDLHVIDWKFGFTPVDVYKNEQLLFYTAGYLQCFSAFKHYKNVLIHIVQPNLDYFGTYKVTLDDIRYIVSATKNAVKTNEFHAGEEQCEWCKAKFKCSEYENWINKKALAVFAAEKALSANITPLEFAGKLIKYKKVFTKAFKQAEDYLKDCTIDEREQAHVKLVAGRKSRVWKEPNPVPKLTDIIPAEELFDTKLKSPAALERKFKLKKHKEFQSLIKTVPGKPILAPLDDKRPAIEPKSLEEVFK